MVLRAVEDEVVKIGARAVDGYVPGEGTWCTGADKMASEARKKAVPSWLKGRTGTECLA